MSFHEAPARPYAGVPLHALLREAGVRADSSRDRALRMRADQVDGVALADNEAPFRLLLVGDPRHNGWARQVTANRVRTED